MIGKINRVINANLKNIPGWSTKRKIVVFSVDDYGNIRVASEAARQNLIKANVEGINRSRFDRFDGLDKADDLAILFETLQSVKDSKGMPAVFTPFVNCANIDFEAIRSNNYDQYRYELLPETLQKLPGYENTWKMWKEGISNGIFLPQFHGREHLNVKLFNELLAKKDPSLIACIDNNSFTGLSLKYYKTIYYNQAFSFDNFDENKELATILADGLDRFEEVFGYRASNFNAPGAYEHEVLESVMHEGGIKYIDSVVVKKEHQGKGEYKKRIRYVGKKNKYNQRYLIRNCVFEPTLTTAEAALDSCLKEIETAFFWNKPAYISSHRVNFTGVISVDNRDAGIAALKTLLKAIVKKWPEVEFMSAQDLGNLIDSTDR